MTKRNALADALAYTSPNGGTWAQHLVDAEWSGEDVLKAVIDLMMKDESLPAEQRAELKSLYCDLFPKDATRRGLILDEDQAPERRWWESLPTPEHVQ